MTEQPASIPFSPLSVPQTFLDRARNRDGETALLMTQQNSESPSTAVLADSIRHKAEKERYKLALRTDAQERNAEEGQGTWSR